MSLFTSLFSPKAPEKPSGKKELVYLMGVAKFDVAITGQEHYQAALEAICGPRRPEGVKQFQTASLKLEINHPRDKNTVRVEIQGKQVGNLPPQAASLFRQQLIARPAQRRRPVCGSHTGWVGQFRRKKGPVRSMARSSNLVPSIIE